MTNLPQGWKMETLGEILSSDKYSIKRGPFGSALKKSFFVEKGIRIFEQYNPINNDPHWKRYFISHEKFQELEAFKATEGDLLISCSGTLGKIVELPKDTEMGIINQALLKIRLNNIKILNSYFIYYFNSPIMQEKILESTLGSAIKNIASVKILKQIEIPLPPLKEQERIVGILDFAFSKIDENIKKAKENLANIDELMQSALQKAFNPLNDNTKENYQLPQSWEWKSLDNIGEIITGTTPSKNNPNFYGNEYPLFKPSDLNGDMIIKYASDNLSKLGFDNARNIPKDTILVVCIGASIGKIGLSGVSGSCNQQINAIIPNSKFLPKFLFFLCLSNYFQEILKNNASQTTLPIINKTEFSKLQIPLPPLQEQEQIAEHLDFVFEKAKALKELYTKELKDYEELKQSLLDKAFKGEL
ncbi:TPA: restriction endonuclease subunit S [Campylobacter jejuni]|nr:restriction endonuclease subunit S [Campylobacter jejuni]HEF6467447.1 restriction endonuclease subunit S [Campylobacter jejuni]HEF7972384.1 restriction endonuclease subunit S [Campylobacter jejuni]HEF7984539.1 restriction endonuclease subunit S [Campylobacter jejuni]HEF8070634.1 restriction endonuclease subunit S [Campylobacter jejuni]